MRTTPPPSSSSWAAGARRFSAAVPRARRVEPDPRGRCIQVDQGGRMRKLSVFAVLAALVAAPAALAKERNITMSAADVAPKAGQPWTAKLRVVVDGTPAPGLGPMVRIVNRAGRAVY